MSKSHKRRRKAGERRSSQARSNNKKRQSKASQALDSIQQNSDSDLVCSAGGEVPFFRPLILSFLKADLWLFWVGVMFPLFVGAIVGKGGVVLDWGLLRLACALLLCGVLTARSNGSPGTSLVSLGLLVGGSSLMIYYHREATWFILLFELLSVLLFVVANREPTNLVALWLRLLALLIVMPLLVVLGVYSQAPDKLRLQVGLLGLVPAFCGSAALLVRYMSIMQEAGWQRVRAVVEYRGKCQHRPGLIALSLSIFLVFLPSLIFSAAAFGIVPFPFIFVLALIVVGGRVMTQYFDTEQERPELERVLWAKLNLLFVTTSFVMAIVGIYSRG